MSVGVPAVGAAGGATFGLIIAVVATPVFARLTESGSLPTAVLVARFSDAAPDEHRLPGILLHSVYGIGVGLGLAALMPKHFTDWNFADSLGQALWSGVVNGAIYGILLFGLSALIFRILLKKPLVPRRVVVLLAFHVVYGTILGAVFAYDVY